MQPSASSRSSRMTRSSRFPVGSGALRLSAILHKPFASGWSSLTGHNRCGTPPAAPSPKAIAPSSFCADTSVEMVIG